MQQVMLHDLAHARTGDKGDIINISLFAYREQDYPWLVEQVSADRVRDWFGHRRPTAVRRYLLPNLAGMNFVLEGVLDGGVNDSLNLDSHGKSLSFHLLSMTLPVAR